MIWNTLYQNNGESDVLRTKIAKEFGGRWTVILRGDNCYSDIATRYFKKYKVQYAGIDWIFYKTQN